MSDTRTQCPKCFMYGGHWPDCPNNPAAASLRSEVSEPRTGHVDHGLTSIASRPRCEGCGNPATHQSGDGYDLCKTCFDATPAAPPEVIETPPSDWKERIAVYAFDIDGYGSLDERDRQACDSAAEWAQGRVEEAVAKLSADLEAANRERDKTYQSGVIAIAEGEREIDTLLDQMESLAEQLNNTRSSLSLATAQLEAANKVVEAARSHEHRGDEGTLSCSICTALSVHDRLLSSRQNTQGSSPDMEPKP